MVKPKVALIHEYLIQYGGAEKTLEEIIDLFPGAPIYTGVYKPSLLSQKINKQKITAPTSSLLGKFPKYFTFLMPFVFESFDLDKYDIIISDGTAWPKGVLTKPHQLHISYVHTPPRFLYKYSVESTKRNKWYFRPFVAIIDFFLRIWDFNAAQRPDYLLVNSEEVRKRVQKFYGRDARVVYPPVEIKYHVDVEKDNLRPPYYLAVGRLAAYKNLDLLVEAFNLLDIPLVIVGTGTEEANLKRVANKNITFTGQLSEEEKHKHLERCLGLINPVVDEDFGIVPLEAVAHGKPVLVHRSGGALETVQEGITGRFFDSTNVEEFVQSIRKFDDEVRKGAFKESEIKESVQRFGRERFKKEFKWFVEEKWEEHRTSRMKGQSDIKSDIKQEQTHA
jgi:glycosyltransferase involved in cell wall biosynthesis